MGRICPDARSRRDLLLESGARARIAPDLGAASGAGRGRSRSPREHDQVSPRALAHLDLGILHRPGPLTFDLFAHGADRRIAVWLGLVVLGTGIAGWFGKLPGVEHAPPFSASRKIDQSSLPSHLLHVRLERGGRVWSAEPRGADVGDRDWRMAAPADLRCCLRSRSPGSSGSRRRGISPAREAIDEARGHERRFFYGTVWAACVAQPVLLLLWKWLPHTRWADAVKFGVFAGTLVVMGACETRAVDQDEACETW